MDPRAKEAMEKLANVAAMLNLGPEVAQIIGHLNMTWAQQTSSVVITEEAAQAVIPSVTTQIATVGNVQEAQVKLELPALPSPPQDDVGRGEYVPLRRPHRRPMEVRDMQEPRTSDQPEPEAQVKPTCAPNQVEEAQAIQPCAPEKVWSGLEARFRAASETHARAIAEMESSLTAIRVARENNASIRELAAASGIREEYIVAKRGVEAFHSATDAERARMTKERASKAKLAEARAEEERTREAAKLGHLHQRRLEGQAKRARQRVFFAELEEEKQRVKEEAWATSPEKFFCPVCGLPGVRRGKDCPRGHRR